MNETKRVDPSFLGGKEPIANGYKIFSWNWTGYNGAYCYADENGNVEGSVHTVTGKIEKCGWGLHFCENPVDCMRYRDLVQWNRFAEVEAFDEVIKADGDDKSVCRTLKIKRVLSFYEMIEACETYQPNANGYGICDSYGIHNGYGILNGYGSGDLLVNVSVYIPESLSRDEKKMVEKLQESDNMKPTSSAKDEFIRRVKNMFN